MVKELTRIKIGNIIIRLKLYKCNDKTYFSKAWANKYALKTGCSVETVDLTKTDSFLANVYLIDSSNIEFNIMQPINLFPVNL